MFAGSKNSGIHVFILEQIFDVDMDLAHQRHH